VNSPLADLISAYVAGDVEHGRVSSISVNGRTLYSYAYPLAYRGRDINGNTTVFLNVAAFPDPNANYLHLNDPRRRDLAYSVTTKRHRRTVERAASDADLNVIECEFVGNRPGGHILSNDLVTLIA
jgi:hypothetical protein